jgi:hypothetical protein
LGAKNKDYSADLSLAHPKLNLTAQENKEKTNANKQAEKTLGGI